MNRRLLLFSFYAASTAAVGWAQTLTSDSTVSGYSTPNAFFGQSFTLASGYTYQISGFAWADGSTPMGSGVGQIYLFSQAYTGTPGQLASASTGLVGVSNVWSSGAYSFPVPLAVNGGATYYAYTSASTPFQLTLDITGAYPGTAISSSGSAVAFANTFGSNPWSYNFQVYGTATPVPEPAAAAGLLGLLALGLAWGRRRMVSRP